MFKRKEKVPVTVITGFLGSGKSTLLNHILTDTSHGKRFAIIENEVGEIAIDDQVVLAAVTNLDEEIVEVTNGCICCNIRGDLIESLNKLYTKVKKFDGILIETTGLADPAPIVQTFFHDDDVARKFELNGVVAVVDAVNILDRLSEKRQKGTTNEALEQIAFADKVLLNKIDLVVDEKMLLKIEDEIDSINPSVDLVRTQHSKVDPMELVNLKGFDLQRALDMDRFFLTKPRKHNPDQAVSNVCCEIEGEVNMEMLTQWIQRLVDSDGSDSDDDDDDDGKETSPQHSHENDKDDMVLYRYKGVIAVKGMKNKFIFQGVGMSFSGDFSPQEWSPDTTTKKSQFVFIGRNLNVTLLRNGFEACRVTKELRFKVGDAVLVNCGKWIDGEVVAHWDEGNAYRVKLKRRLGGEVWAPVDIDEYIRAPSTL